MIEKLFVIVNCDTDPIIVPKQKTVEKETAWEKTVENVIKLKEEIKNFEDEYGNNLKITWHLRSDHQIYNIWGNWCYPVREYASLWNEFEKSGDEIGWHPHLWRLDKTKNIWYQEIDDNNWISNCLKNGYHEISKIFRIKSVRMGWGFHNNYTMNILHSLGIRYDLSAAPDIKNKGSIRNIYDWEGTTKYPYFPSKHNYKIEDKNLSENLEIMEIPITTYPIPFYLRALTRKKNMVANIAKHPLFFRNAIKTAIKNGKERDRCVLNVYFHPSDIEKKGFLFSLNNYKRNLLNIYEVSKSKKIEILFITPAELINYYW